MTGDNFELTLFCTRCAKHGTDVERLSKEDLTDHIEDAHPDARKVLLIGHRVEVG